MILTATSLRGHINISDPQGPILDPMQGHGPYNPSVESPTGFIRPTHIGQHFVKTLSY